MPIGSACHQPAVALVRSKGWGGPLGYFDPLYVPARGLFRAGEIKIFPGYSFPNEKDRRSTTSDPR
jgi:hypothetical protein